jgi:hypothetical protein
MIKLRMVVGLACALALTACGLTPPATPGAPPPSRQDAVVAVAETAARVADAINVAPPATLSRTTIDEKFVRSAFLTFDTALHIIDGLRDTGVLVPGTPKAHKVRDTIRLVQRWLNAASSAQKAGNAATYTEALRNARAALASLQTSL